MAIEQRISVEEYEQMIEQGILTEDDRVELIRGEIVEKMSVGGPHASCVKRLNHLFSQRLGNRAVISIQDPVRMGDSVPEPDVAILLPREDFYGDTLPQASDVVLLIEVAESSLFYDRGTKLSLYAEQGIAEYWIVNLIDDCLEVYRAPQPSGEYSDVSSVGRGESIGLLGFPELTLRFDEIAPNC